LTWVILKPAQQFELGCFNFHLASTEPHPITALVVRQVPLEVSSCVCKYAHTYCPCRCSSEHALPETLEYRPALRLGCLEPLAVVSQAMRCYHQNPRDTYTYCMASAWRLRHHSDHVVIQQFLSQAVSDVMYQMSPPSRRVHCLNWPLFNFTLSPGCGSSKGFLIFASPIMPVSSPFPSTAVRWLH
jgi:hypothetical protein